MRTVCVKSYPALVLLLSSAQLLAQGVFRIGEREELDIGRRLAIEIEMDHPMLEDSFVAAWVQRLGQRLARDSGRPEIRYRFRVINSDEVDAFALPGGYVYVTRGMIEATGDESQLAAVLAHEIGHVAARHHARNIRREQFENLGFSLMGPVFGRGAKAAVKRITGRQLLAGVFVQFSREDEREADRAGAKNLYDAGYDPHGMVALFEKLARMRESRPGLLRSLFATHPEPEDRAENIAELAASFPPKRFRAGSEAYGRARKRLAELRAATTAAVPDEPPAAHAEEAQTPEAREREIAAWFAPLFYQGLGSHPRYDYIAAFDFDGDWRGDNNWQNAANRDYRMKAWIYYAVRETSTHFFLHYAAFHPRDYKGGKRRGPLLSRAIRAAVNRGARYDPTGRAEEAVLAHENDLEGCLVVVEKRGADPRRGRVVFVETMAHNSFLKYVPAGTPHPEFASVPVEGRRVSLFIEPRGHGIEAWRGDQAQLANCENGVKIYTFTGVAEDAELHPGGPTGYDLVPIYATLWPEALRGLTPTYAETEDYGSIFVKVAGPDGEAVEREVTVGRIGTAFRGDAGGKNLARPPWAWFDGADRNQPRGEWFFDPARAIRRHFGLGDGFSIAYPGYELPGPAR